MLTAIWLVPTVGAVLVTALPRRFSKWTAVIVSTIGLALALYVAFAFDASRHSYQFVERTTWIADYHIDYHLGVDGISLWLIVLNAFLTLIAVLATPLATVSEPRFLALLLLLEAGMAGAFLAVDLVLFYVFWEAMLIPAYFLLWGWGEGPRASYAAIKFILYTLAGSLLMLVGVIAEYFATGQSTFDISKLASVHPSSAAQFGLFFLFALAFAIKIPLFPFHSWLPDAYMAAPTPFLVTFAGVMGKIGAYGLLRIVLPLFPHPVYWWDWNWVMPVLGVAGIVWGAFLAVAQRDMKSLVAYSSISHMGFIVVGIFSLNAQGAQGAVLQMVNHGIIIAALFLIVAWIALRTGTRDRSALAGLGWGMPAMAGVFLVVTLAALGLPGLNSFVGEFMTLLGAWQRSPILAVVSCIGLVLAPVYMLRLFQGAMQGPRPAATRVFDLRFSEGGILAPLVLLMFFLGLYPYFLTRVMNAVGQPVPWQ
jgi:NADH-quinone oxidoreductase subunit M